MSVQVYLSAQEVIDCWNYVGRVKLPWRWITGGNGKHGGGDSFGKNPDLGYDDFIGMLGEAAVAKYLGVDMDKFLSDQMDLEDEGDVGKEQVRFSKATPPVLIIRPSDRWSRKKKGQRFWLVTLPRDPEIIGMRLWESIEEEKHAIFFIHGFYVPNWLEEETRVDDWETDFGNGRPKCWAIPVGLGLLQFPLPISAQLETQESDHTSAEH